MIRWLVFVFGFVFKKDPPSALTQRPITHGVEGAPTPTTATVGGGGGSDGSWFNVLPQHAGALSDVEPPLPVSGDEGGGALSRLDTGDRCYTVTSTGHVFKI